MYLVRNRFEERFWKNMSSGISKNLYRHWMQFPDLEIHDELEIVTHRWYAVSSDWIVEARAPKRCAIHFWSVFVLSKLVQMSVIWSNISVGEPIALIFQYFILCLIAAQKEITNWTQPAFPHYSLPSFQKSISWGPPLLLHGGRNKCPRSQKMGSPQWW